MTVKGFVYVMSNESMPGLIKIGMSTKIPEERAKELSSATSTPTPFTVEYYALFDDMRKAERLAHQKMQRYHHGKEFFQAPPEKAIQAIERLGISFSKIFSKPDNDRKVRELEEKRLLQQREEEKKVLLDKFYLQKKELDKLLEAFPVKNGPFINYNTDKIIESYNKTQETFKQLTAVSNYIERQKKEIAELYKRTTLCIEERKKQDRVVVDTRSKGETNKELKKIKRKDNASNFLLLQVIKRERKKDKANDFLLLLIGAVVLFYIIYIIQLFGNFFSTGYLPDLNIFISEFLLGMGF